MLFNKNDKVKTIGSNTFTAAKLFLQNSIFANLKQVNPVF